MPKLPRGTVSKKTHAAPKKTVADTLGEKGDERLENRELRPMAEPDRLSRRLQPLDPWSKNPVERLDPVQQPAVLIRAQVRIPEIGRIAPVDPPLLDSGGVVPHQLVVELVLLRHVVSAGVEQVEVVIGVLTCDHEFRPQFVTTVLCPG